MINEIERSLHTAHQYTQDFQDLIDLRFARTNYKHAVWETPSEFTVHCYKQMTEEKRAYLWRREKLDDEHRAPTYKLTAYEPIDEVDHDKIKTSFPPNYVHSIDASVMHFVLASTPENQPVVGVHDALGSLIRDAKDVRQRFRTAIHRIYAHQHPYRTIIEGVPQEIAWIEEEQASKFVATIRHAPHLIN
jgi:DNA-directed RNA polymerase